MSLIFTKRHKPAIERDFAKAQLLSFTLGTDVLCSLPSPFTKSRGRFVRLHFSVFHFDHCFQWLVHVMVTPPKSLRWQVVVIGAGGAIYPVRGVIICGVAICCCCARC